MKDLKTGERVKDVACTTYNWRVVVHIRTYENFFGHRLLGALGSLPGSEFVGLLA